MKIDDIRPYLVKINNGSGCLVQPVDDGEYTYILTVRHVLAIPNEKETAWTGDKLVSIERFELENGNWKARKIYLDEANQLNELSVGENYFPHKTKDLALIKIRKIAELDRLIRDDLPENKGATLFNYSLCGYPGIRAGDSVEYRFDPDIKILTSAGYGLREAEHPKLIEKSELEGFSGGGILKYTDENILLAGVIKKMQRRETLGRIYFYPLYNFDEIIEEYNDKLKPIFSERRGAGSYGEVAAMPREVISININDSFKDNRVKDELIELLRENSRGLIVNPNVGDWEYFLNECNEEVLRDVNEGVINNNKKGIITSIGTSLFRILHRDRNHAKNINKVIESENPTSLQLDFTYWKHNNQQLNYSSIPWEYLFCPEDLSNNGLSYPIIRNTLITRSIRQINGSLTARLKKLKVVIVAEEDFLLNSSAEDNTQIKVSEALQKLVDPANADYLNFTFLEIKNISLTELQTKLFRYTPNIIHIVGNASWIKDKPELFVKKDEGINLERADVLREKFQKAAESGMDENRLFLCILQSTFKHQVEQYRAFDGIATVLLKNKLPSVVSIPHCLGRDADFFLLKSFYNDIAQGKSIGESFFSLSNEIRLKESIGFPALYSHYNSVSIIKELKIHVEHKEESIGNRRPSFEPMAAQAGFSDGRS